ncbi:DAHP synthetase [Aspergillus ambiguus]|uniref:DAHP synthetase n=1 Tax=Aspergillus ambiguus TaxID=176160 RepID=UPI003CCCA70D
MWTPSTWRGKTANLYTIEYSDNKQVHARSCLSKLAHLPPLVTPSEVSHLRVLLKEVALGQRVIWQCGDCAELFDHCETTYIADRVRLLSQLSLVFSLATNIPVVRIGRMAGQYGKPRNGLTEEINGTELPKFYGDVINSFEPSRREPDPDRMLLAYFHAGCTLNYMRALARDSRIHETAGAATNFTREGSFLGIECSSITERQKYHHSDQLTNPVFTSHECLFLHYEQAFTRPWWQPGEPAPADAESAPGRFYNSSAHFLWVGDKTRQLDGAHVEYIRGLQNPVGIKVGPSTNADELVDILNLIDPHYEPGKVVLISRLGQRNVSQLGPLVRAVQESRHPVIWQCDPMHGNTRMTDGGIRTRDLASMLAEITSTIEIHRQHNSWLGGIHLETTPDEDVVECVGGINGPQDKEIGGFRYKTKCDPRLNRKQTMEIALEVARLYTELHRRDRVCRARM